MKYPRIVAGVATASLAVGLSACTSPEGGPELGPTPTIDATTDAPDNALDLPYIPRCSQRIIDEAIGGAKGGGLPSDLDPEGLVYDAAYALEGAVGSLRATVPGFEQPSGRHDWSLTGGEGEGIFTTEQALRFGKLVTVHYLVTMDPETGEQCEVAGLTVEWTQAGSIGEITTTSPGSARLTGNKIGSLVGEDLTEVTPEEAERVAVTAHIIEGVIWGELATSLPPPIEDNEIWV